MDAQAIQTVLNACVQSCKAYVPLRFEHLVYYAAVPLRLEHSLLCAAVPLPVVGMQRVLACMRSGACPISRFTLFTAATIRSSSSRSGRASGRGICCIGGRANLACSVVVLRTTLRSVGSGFAGWRSAAGPLPCGRCEARADRNLARWICKLTANM